MHDSSAPISSITFRYSCLTFLALCLMPAALAVAGANSCMDCHAFAASGSLQASHVDWDRSIHARLHVACEVCHAGNPREADKRKAHQGVYGAMDPRSTVYYTKIPGLCGQCHVREFSDFQRSSHYRVLTSEGTGPDCIACHDAMATKVIGAEAVERLCHVCHNPGNKHLPEVGGLARDILRRMANIGRTIAEARKQYDKAIQQGANQDKALGFLILASREFHSSKDSWHTFQLQRMMSRLDGVDRLIQQGLDAMDDDRAGSP